MPGTCRINPGSQPGCPCGGHRLYPSSQNHQGGLDVGVKASLTASLTSPTQGSAGVKIVPIDKNRKRYPFDVTSGLPLCLPATLSATTDALLDAGIWGCSTAVPIEESRK